MCRFTMYLGPTIRLSSLIVGVVTLVIGYVMVRAARSKVQPSAFIPERTAQSVMKDTETAKRAVQ